MINLYDEIPEDQIINLKDRIKILEDENKNLIKEFKEKDKNFLGFNLVATISALSLTDNKKEIIIEFESRLRDIIFTVTVPIESGKKLSIGKQVLMPAYIKE